MDRAKLIEKIQKCLSLSKSPEPHEAAAALRQAQKLIALHGVTDNELGFASYASEKVDCPVQAGRTLPEYLATLCSLMQRAFGVRVTVHREIRVSDPSWCVTYYGKADRVALAAYSHPVVWRAMHSSWAQFQKNNPQLKGVTGARSGFFIGWIFGVAKCVTDLGLSDEERQELDSYFDNEVGKVAQSATSKVKMNTRAVHAGIEASRNFSLHRPIGG